MAGGSFDNGIGLIFCRKCGNKLPQDALFCAKFGEAVRPNAPMPPREKPALKSWLIILFGAMNAFVLVGSIAVVIMLVISG